MVWESGAEGLLRALLEMVPATMRPLAESTARDESELVAQDRGGDAVTGHDVLRGWIRTTPPEQRDGLVEVIDSLGYEPEDFADELGSAEGWNEEGA